MKLKFPRISALWHGLKSKILCLAHRWQETPPMCENVKDWAIKQPPTIAQLLEIQLLSTQSISIPLPPAPVAGKTYSRLQEMFVRKSRYVNPEKYLVSIAGARLVGQSGTIILPDGAYTVETAFRKERLVCLPEYYSVIEKIRLRKVKKSGQYFSLLQLFCNGNNYYHWMHDVLQKLYLVLDLLPKNVVFIVPQGLKTWQYAALAAIGINQDQTLVFPHDEIWQLDTLYFSPPTTKPGGHVLPAIAWVRDCHFQMFDIDREAGQRSELIFISRAAAKGRKIINEREVQALLTQHGFKTYVLEDMSIQQQVALFAQARAVVATHGAGLTNLIFSPIGTRILEIFEPSAGFTCFWSLSDCLKHQYTYLVGETRANLQFSSQPNIFVPLDQLALSLQTLVKFEVSQV